MGPHWTRTSVLFALFWCLRSLLAWDEVGGFVGFRAWDMTARWSLHPADRPGPRISPLMHLVYVCMYVCMYAYMQCRVRVLKMYACMDACIYIYIHIYIYRYTCIRTHTQIYIYIYIYIYNITYVHTYYTYIIYIHTHIHIHTHIYTYTYIYIYISIYISIYFIFVLIVVIKIMYMYIFILAGSLSGVVFAAFYVLSPVFLLQCCFSLTSKTPPCARFSHSSRCCAPRPRGLCLILALFKKHDVLAAAIP